MKYYSQIEKDISFKYVFFSDSNTLIEIIENVNDNVLINKINSSKHLSYYKKFYNDKNSERISEEVFALIFKKHYSLFNLNNQMKFFKIEKKHSAEVSFICYDLTSKFCFILKLPDTERSQLHIFKYKKIILTKKKKIKSEEFYNEFVKFFNNSN